MAPMSIGELVTADPTFLPRLGGDAAAGKRLLAEGLPAGDDVDAVLALKGMIAFTFYGDKYILKGKAAAGGDRAVWLMKQEGTDAWYEPIALLRDIALGRALCAADRVAPRHAGDHLYAAIGGAMKRCGRRS